MSQFDQLMCRFSIMKQICEEAANYPERGGGAENISFFNLFYILFFTILILLVVTNSDRDADRIIKAILNSVMMAGIVAVCSFVGDWQGGPYSGGNGSPEMISAATSAPFVPSLPVVQQISPSSPSVPAAVVPAPEASPSAAHRCDGVASAGGRLATFGPAVACYATLGCAATRVICSVLGSDETGGLPCSAAAASKLELSDDVLAMANAAAREGCFADAMGWLAGAPASLGQAAADQAVVMVGNLCSHGGVAESERAGMFAGASRLAVDIGCLSK